ncbi:MAG: riboflavin kinase, partial [Planctomycetota bacterium]
MSSVSPPTVYSASGRWTPAAPACAVAVGNFDGVHVGHVAIVERLRAAAGERGLPAVVFTFDPHPVSIVRPDAAPVPLTTPRRRADLLAALGVDAVLVQPTDRQLVALEAEDFYREILRGRLRAAAVVEGLDFHFGARRRGDVALLGQLCAADKVFLAVVEPVLHDGESVSSSRLRRLVNAGLIRAANRLLTAAYRATGTVIEGARRGQTIGFPTANLGGIATLLPAAGVYAAHVVVDDDGTTWPVKFVVDSGPSAYSTIARLADGKLGVLYERGPYAAGRRFVDAGVPVALGSNFNPLLTPVLSMQAVISLACSRLGLTAAEAVTAATVNAAHALRCSER